MGRKLPEGWEKKNIGFLTEFEKKTGRSAKDGVEKDEKNIYKFFKSGEDKDVYSDKYDFDGEYLTVGDGGSANIHYINGKFGVSGHNFVFKSKKEKEQNLINNKLLFYYLFGSKDKWNKLYTGIGMTNISKTDFQNIDIFFPTSPTEQQKIVSYLDKQFKFIDNMESEINTYKDKLEKLEKGILEEAFSSVEENKIELGNLFDITSSKRIYESDYVTSGIPFYRSKEIIEKSQNKPTNINLFISNEKFEEIKSKYGAPKKGDILITAVGTIGIPYIVQDEVFYFKDGNLLWLKNQGKIEQKYLIYFLKSSFFRKFIDDKKGGAVYSALTIENLKNFEIYYPELNIQKSIAYKLDKQFELINSTRQEINNQIKNLKDLRKAMLNDIFGGFEE